MYQMRAYSLAAVLALGFAGVLSTSASADRYDPGCNCNRPDSFFEKKRVVHEAPRVVQGNRRVVNTVRVIPRTNVVDHNNLVVHVRPVIRRDVIVKRENIVYRNITVHRENNTHRTEEKFRNTVSYQNEQGSVRTINEVRYVKGRDCNCGGTTRSYEGGRSYGGRSYEGDQYVSSRY